MAKKKSFFDVRHEKWIDTEKETKHTENWIFKNALSHQKWPVAGCSQGRLAFISLVI